MNVNGIEFVEHPDGYWVPTGNSYIKNSLAYVTEDEVLDKVLVVESLEPAIVIHAMCNACDYDNLSKTLCALRDKLRADNPGKDFGLYITPTFEEMHSWGGVFRC